MPKEDIRRYTMEQIREMNRRGEFVPTPPDAPEYEPDEEFWQQLEAAAKARKAKAAAKSKKAS
jgi:hypothetical protein